MTDPYTQCRYLRRNGEQCTAEAIDGAEDALIGLCIKHLGRAVQMFHEIETKAQRAERRRASGRTARSPQPRTAWALEIMRSDATYADPETGEGIWWEVVDLYGDKLSADLAQALHESVDTAEAARLMYGSAARVGHSALAELAQNCGYRVRRIGIS